MDQNMNDFPESDTPFSFQHLLYGDDYGYRHWPMNQLKYHHMKNSTSREELLLISEQIKDVGTGLDVDVIDGNLNRRRYEDRSGQAEKCVICLDELKYNDDASKLACGHDFHFECIKNWLMVQNKCPLCKQQALSLFHEAENLNVLELLTLIFFV
ncbi:probable E3 ubiquitin-protein ligase RHG1A [Brassica napus]|uniref:probable E3 ubiquitin-protein ligase RHG1A n=1 Tax=Brassica napus TaxID=3708 RepID=UPI000BBE2D86|nr:probable E3 ubiquitin-protein ligase RHG1A [Brassica napus]